MDYKFLLIALILIIVNITILFTLSLCAIISINILAHSSDDLLTYYIYNMRYSIFCASVYILFFILFLYGLRLWNINHVIDLRILYYNILSIFELSWITYVPSILFGIIIIINAFLYLVRIHKHCIHHIYILYLYMRYIGNIPGIDFWFFNKLSRPHTEDIITYYVGQLLFKIDRYILQDRKFNGLSWTDWRVKVPWYFISFHFRRFFTKIIYYGKPSGKYYYRFISLSPILVVFYDCVFNDFVVNHLHYYLLIYIPVILWRRVTNCIFFEALDICELLCNIYYKKETCIYAIHSKLKPILDSYIRSGLKSNVNLFLDGLDIEMYLKSASRFVPDADEFNVYRNAEGLAIERKSENSFVCEKSDDTIEEWILIADKHHFNNNKYKTLVFIN